MKVKMLYTINGPRNGQPWPRRGGTIDLPDKEAWSLVKNGTAEPVAEKAPEEQATIKQEDVETREDKGSRESDEKAEEEAADTEEETARPRRGRPPKPRED